MKAYYQDDFVTLYHADFRSADPFEPVDLVVADPPYEETGLAWDVWPIGWPSWLVNRVKASASFWCWGSFRMFRDHWEEFADWSIAQDIVWEKHNGTSLHNDRFRKVHEHVVQYYRRGCKWGAVHKEPIIRQVREERGHRSLERSNKPQHWGEVAESHAGYDYDGTRLARSVIFERSSHGSAVHPTQKPLGLTRDLIAYSCPRGGVTLDVFAGSGTTLVAAKELGRRAIGFEAVEKYCEAAAQRLTQGILIDEH